MKNNGKGNFKIQETEELLLYWILSSKHTQKYGFKSDYSVIKTVLGYFISWLWPSYSINCCCSTFMSTHTKQIQKHMISKIISLSFGTFKTWSTAHCSFIQAWNVLHWLEILKLSCQLSGPLYQKPAEWLDGMREEVLNQLAWHSPMPLASFHSASKRVMILSLIHHHSSQSVCFKLACGAQKLSTPLTSFVSLSDTDAGVVSLGGAKDLCGERDRSCGAACIGGERTLSPLQPRLLQQQGLHLFALPTWNPLRRHLR